MHIIVNPAAKIAIIGGGIGGLASALALRQVGYAPEVFEQAPELLEVGAAIALWPNAMRILEQLGLGEEILHHAGTIEQVRWLDFIRESSSIQFDYLRASHLHRAPSRRLQSVHCTPRRSLRFIWESLPEPSTTRQREPLVFC